MKHFLDFAGLQEYDNLIKEYIRGNSSGITQLTTDFVFENLSNGNYLVTYNYKDILFSANGVSNVSVSSLFPQLGENAFPILVYVQDNGVGFVPLSTIGNIDQIETQEEINVYYVVYKLVENTYKKIDFVGAIPSKTLLETLKKSQPNVIENINIVNSKGVTELQPTNKTVNIDLNEYLSTLTFGNVSKTVKNNLINFSQAEIKNEIESIINVATHSANGFMSNIDKQHLDSLYELLGEVSGDADKFVNTINEILAIFDKYPEGSNLITVLSNKVDKEEGKGLSTYDFNETYRQKVLNSVSQIEFNNALENKVDKIQGKSLSTNDYTNEDKQKLANTVSQTQLNSSLNEKVDKELGKGLSSNDFTNDYKTKVDNSITKNEVNEELKSFVKKTTEINGQNLYGDIAVAQYRGLYLSNFTYYIGDLVTHSNKVWKCLETHSSSSFDRAKWQRISYLNIPNEGDEIGLFTYEEKTKLDNLPTNQLLNDTFAKKYEVENTYVKKENNKGLSTNDFTNDYKETLDNLENTHKNLNYIKGVLLNGTEITPIDRYVNITTILLKEVIGNSSNNNIGLMTQEQFKKLTSIQENATKDSPIELSFIENLFSNNN